MFVNAHGRVIPLPAQAESMNIKANLAWGTQESRNGPGYPRRNGHSAASVLYALPAV